MKNTVQVFGRKKNSIALAMISGPGNGLIRLNGVPLDLVQPELLKIKAFEPLLLCKEKNLEDIDIRIRVHGGGKVAQIYAVRQAISRGLMLYLEKYMGESYKTDIKTIFNNYDRTLLVTDCRKIEPKKSGGRGARSKYQKSYR
nr:40S ribosomal protein S16 [Cryptomonas paramecium]